MREEARKAKFEAVEDEEVGRTSSIEERRFCWKRRPLADKDEGERAWATGWWANNDRGFISLLRGQCHLSTSERAALPWARILLRYAEHGTRVYIIHQRRASEFSQLVNTTTVNHRIKMKVVIDLLYQIFYPIDRKLAFIAVKNLRLTLFADNAD